MGSLSGTNGKSKGKKSNASKPEFRFINHDLDKQAQEELEGLFEAGEWGFSDVLAEVEAGYAFKVSRDSRGGGFRAHFICEIEGHADENACLSGRGSAPAAAVYALLYRHLVLAPDGWGVLSGGDGQSGMFG